MEKERTEVWVFLTKKIEDLRINDTFKRYMENELRYLNIHRGPCQSEEVNIHEHTVKIVSNKSHKGRVR